MHEGNFAAAMQELEQADQLSRFPLAERPVRPMDWRVHSRAFASFVLWVSGYPSRAVARIGEAFMVARELAASANDRLFTCWWSGYLHLLLRDSATAARLTDQAIELVRQQLPAFVTTCIPLDSWALVQQGHIDAGLSKMLQLRSNTEQDTGTLFFETWQFLALGNAYLGSGLASEGIAAMDEGLELCRTTGVRLLEGEIHRLKGELLLIGGNDEAAAQSFRDAIDLSRRQSAKSWELRATSSLARLLVSQERGDEARRMLAEIYGWFTEGFDTADLKEARLLLEQLGS
jgi:predicted ATPase